MAKWANVDAGPKQVKDFNRAVSNLRSEGQTHDEIYGVAGVSEHTSSLMTMFGPVRPEVTALDEAIGEKYGYQVTRKNVREIIAAYEAAVPEARKSRPVVDERRTPEQDAEIKAKVAAQNAEYQAKRDAENAVLGQVMAKAPAGAKGLIVAELKVDNSDVQSDYFSNRGTRTVAIGWRMSAREDFRALHAAAAQFSEIKGTEFTEHRENYSMGRGNYLSDHGWDGAGSGWVIKSCAFPCTYLNLTEDAIPVTPETPQGGNGFYDQHGTWIPQAPGTASGPVTVTPSSIGREGVVEVRFAEKPDADTISALKAHRFRWARGNRCWYGSDVAYAEALTS